MELRHLKYFVVVAEELNFTRAAKRLHTAQPSLSQQILDLEDDVGTPLFYRNKRRVELTRAGVSFLHDARQVLEKVDQAVVKAQEAARTVSGSLAIGFVPSAEIKVFPKILPILRTKHPDVHIVLHSMDAPAIEDGLWERRVDVAFLRKNDLGQDFVVEKVFSEALVAVLPADHSLARQKAITPAMLEKHHFIAVSDVYAPELHQIVKQFLKAGGVHVSPVQTAENLFTNLNLISMGLGVGVLPDYVGNLGTKGITLRPIDPSQSIDLNIAWRRAQNSPVLGSFLEVLRSTKW